MLWWSSANPDIAILSKNSAIHIKVPITPTAPEQVSAGILLGIPMEPMTNEDVCFVIEIKRSVLCYEGIYQQQSEEG